MIMNNYEQKYKKALEAVKFLQEVNPSDEGIQNWVKDNFPELKESENERIRNGLIALLKFGLEDGSAIAPGFNVTKEQALAWLEKQREQKPYGQRKECEDCQFNYVGECKGYCQMKKDEQKHADNVEPKFKVGDWIILPLGIIAHIDSINSTDYQVTTTDGKICDFKISKQDNYRLWSINDAKDGDVLASELSGSIFLFRGIKDNKIDFYCDYDTELEWPEHRFGINDTDQHYGSVEESQDIHPATKEQRDLLFAKMKEAGYEYNNEKKELNKNDQTSADKNESKFNVGNWYQCTKDFFGKGVTFDKNTAYYCAQEGCLQNEYGCHIAIVKDLYDNFKLWSIEDAKDGDVLSGEINGDKYIFSFKKLNGRWIETQGVCYCETTGECIEDARFCNHYQDFFKPASKEECDVLLLKTVNHQLK